MEKKCEIGKTEFVNEKDVGRGVSNKGTLKTNPKLKIKSNVFQCKGGKEMKGDVYGIK